MFLLVHPAVFTCAAPGALIPHQAAAMTHDSIRVTITTDRPRYAVGQPISLSLTVANESTTALVLHFSTGQRFDFLIRDAGGETVWRWSTGKAFIQMMGQERLEPGETLSYEATFEGSLEPGRYSAVGRLVSADQPLQTSVGFVVH